MTAFVGKTILITGGSGFIGRKLVSHFRDLGYSVRVLGRKGGDPGMYRWDPAAGQIDKQAIEGVDAVIHLAGESIAGGLWTGKKRRRILESRVQGTRLLVSALSELPSPPSVFVSASGVNAYGASQAPATEQSPSGEGFLAGVCRAWEAEAGRANAAGMRTVIVRTGIVLDKSGGVMEKLLPAFRLGLGGRIGSGSQGFPWISLEDLAGIYSSAVEDDRYEGILNAVHPDLVDQATFARTLAGLLGRPLLFPVPETLIRVILGRLGSETLLADLRICPEKLVRLGFSFRHDTLAATLSGILNDAIPLR